MKPGLRKVIALILVSVTLFGSGASAVSAAYADDTTIGTSTRIQAEPDVKTTTGGDEAEGVEGHASRETNVSWESPVETPTPAPRMGRPLH